MLVPFTQEQLDETDFELTHQHIVALESDIECIRSALQTIKYKVRPRVAIDHSVYDANGSRKRAKGEHGEPWVRSEAAQPWQADRGGDETDEDDVPVDVEVQHEFAPRTDSSIGFPAYPYQADV